MDIVLPEAFPYIINCDGNVCMSDNRAYTQRILDISLFRAIRCVFVPFLWLITDNIGMRMTDICFVVSIRAHGYVND